ncbi:MAG: class IV adenylate cyclase, partial [Patescibacteria group bacterium]
DMKNIELKVKVDNIKPLVRSLRTLGAHFAGTLKQKDTYYNCHEGRLKIREINGKEFMFIHYNRPDTASHKISDFEILELTKSQCLKLKNILGSSLGIKVTVDKTRKLWMYKNTRIHLDDVNGLGKFLELESKITTSESHAKKEYDALIEALSLNNFIKIKKSYSDLLLVKS